MNKIIISKSRGLFRMYIYAFNGLMPVCLGRKLRWINIKRSLFSGTLKKIPVSVNTGIPPCKKLFSFV